MGKKETFNQRIAELVGELDLEWFLKMKEAFVSHENYDESRKEIYKENTWHSPNYWYDENGDQNFEDYVEQGDVVKIDLRKYCSSWLPISMDNYWGLWAIENSRGSGPYSGIPMLVLEEAIEFLKGVQSPLEISKVIVLVGEDISDCVRKTLDGVAKEDDFANVLMDFRDETIKLLHTNFSRFLELDELIQKYEDKLEFNLQQEELAALLFILNKAGFLNTKNFDHSPFIPFCVKYFRFKKKDEYVKIKNKETFADKYREIIRLDSGLGLLKVKEKLDETIKDLEN